MRLVRMCFLVTMTVFISTWAYAPIRMTPDEIESNNGPSLSRIRYQKREVIELKDYFFFTIERKREYYEVSFNVHDNGDPLCSLSGNISTTERYGYCDEYIAKIQVQSYEAPDGMKKFLNIDIYDHRFDRYRIRVSKKVPLKT